MSLTSLAATGLAGASDAIPGWRLMWSDEFAVDGPPDPTKWGFEEGFVRNEELQWYQPQNASIEGGLLVIEAKRERVSNPNFVAGSQNWRTNRRFADYTSASFNTRGRFSWQYGLLEVRARIETDPGLWPAIWTLGVSGEWPSNGECDVMEFYRPGGVPSLLANTAWGTSTRWVARWDSAVKPLSDFTAADPAWASDFHIWRMEWNEDRVILSLDGLVLNTTELTQTINPDGSNPFRQPHYLLLNLAVGSNGGDPSATEFPRRYEIDYVRIYQTDPNEEFWIAVDDRDSAAITYGPGWGIWDGNPGYLGTEHFSETPGAEATFTFDGSRARFHGFRRSDLGQADIYLDGVYQETIDCYAPNPAYDVLLWQSPELPATTHTLTVRVAETANPASSGTELIIDRFAWLPPLVGAPWQSRWFTASEIENAASPARARADGDSDGVTTLAEAVFGSDPTSQSSTPRVTMSLSAENQAGYRFRRLRDLAGVDLRIECSDNLTDWTDLVDRSGVVESVEASALDAYDDVLLEIPLTADEDRLFIRGVVTEVP